MRWWEEVAVGDEETALLMTERRYGAEAGK